MQLMKDLLDLPQPKLPGLTAEPVLPPVAELAAKPPQTPDHGQLEADLRAQAALPPAQPKLLRPAMDDPEDDPWNTPDVHKGHDHAKLNGNSRHNGHSAIHGQSSDYDESPAAADAANQSPSQYASEHSSSSAAHGSRLSGSEAQAATGPNTWHYFGSTNSQSSVGPFSDNPTHITAGTGPNVFGGDGGSVGQTPPGRDPAAAPRAARPTSGRTGSSIEETITVTLMPGKEGVFLFQHHNYEVASQRRGSKVIRRYSDFVWLLDCLHKRYPFRVLPLLPPKRVAVNGNHLSNDGAFIEKRRRGLARFLNALVRHPVLGQEQLVVMFLTVPTVSVSLPSRRRRRCSLSFFNP